MPTYQYRCATCQNRFDAVQRFADDPLTGCPSCGGMVRRVIQPVGVVFKGSGWYINDSRKTNSPDTASDAAAPKSDAAKLAASATEKPATEATPEPAKTESKPAAAAAD